MLSILIPVYNYNILPLVEQLHREATALHVPFELLVCDDASTQVFHQKQIEQLPHTRWLTNRVNQHVAYTRNRLLNEAQYPWILLLDADVQPISTTFIQNYLNQIGKGLFFQGGFTYPPIDPTEHSSLRLTYGRTIEQYKHLHSCCNLFFNQEKLQLTFDASITEYGFEDTLFFLALAKRNCEVIQINNPVIHQSTESNQTYLERSKQACWGLVELIQKGKIRPQEAQLSHVYQQLLKYRLTFFLSLLSALLGSHIQRNLLGKKPSMLGFKWFKLLEYHKANQVIQKN
ncbi:glycosyltransferase family 2 protein [Myroides sp. DW712]|uniref:glycosyltransferase family 2 protein n=1 Tax=Myroides sp. DW712 TaxID=3389800 RepID=UPI00397D5BE8